MKKHIKILLLLFIIFTGFIMAWFFLFRYDRIAIPTQSGDVWVYNFKKSPQQILPYNSYIIKDTENYNLLYTSNDNNFLITIYNSDIRNTRTIAENDLLKILKINKSQACKLYVSLIIPPIVNAEAAGIDYKLDFCPNGIPLPGEAAQNQSTQSSAFQNFLNFLKNPIAAAFLAALVIVGGIILFARR